MENPNLSHTYRNLPAFTDEQWEDYDPVELLQLATGELVVEMDTPDDYVYIVFSHPGAKDCELNFRYEHQARLWLQTADIVAINDHLEVIQVDLENEWIGALEDLLHTIYNYFQQIVIGSRSVLGIDCKNPNVDGDIAEYARETLQEKNFDIEYTGRSGGYMVLSHWENTGFYCYDLNDLGKILELINQATGDPNLWENFEQDLSAISEQVNDFKSKTMEDFVECPEPLSPVIDSPEMLWL